jgi:hypothetical protein
MLNYIFWKKFKRKLKYILSIQISKCFIFINILSFLVGKLKFTHVLFHSCIHFFVPTDTFLQIFVCNFDKNISQESAHFFIICNILTCLKKCMPKTCSLKDFLQTNTSQLIINFKIVVKYLGWTLHPSHKQ